mgnify:CR=1 FL=1
MSDEHFGRCLQFVLKWETGGDLVNGGYTNDPNDPGGETKWGISKRAHPKLDIPNLTLDQAADIYEREYWQPAGCGDMEPPRALAVFNLSVLMGLDDAESVAWMPAWRDVAFYQITKHCRVVKKNPKLKRYLWGWCNRWLDLVETCQRFQGDEGK